MLAEVKSQVFPSVDLMRAAEDRVQRMFSGVEPDEVGADRLRAAVAKLRKNEALTSRELRTCCAGAGTPVNDKEGSVMDDAALTAALLRLVEDRSGIERLHRRCLAGLLSALTEPAERPVLAASSSGPSLVVQYLAPRLAGLEAPDASAVFEFVSGRAPGLFQSYVLQGDRTAVRPLQAFRTPEPSWVWREVFADAIGQPAPDFVASVDGILDLTDAHPSVIDAVLGQILNRFTGMQRVDEHERVCNLVVDRWGSPLLSESIPYWDRHTSVRSREMVARWLRRRVIGAFFEGLSVGGADPRRARFWSRYADAADEVTLYLGEAARRTGSTLVELRQVLGNRVRNLDDAEISVFSLRIGEFEFVEFSTTGNALYVYERASLPDGFRANLPRVVEFKDKGIAEIQLRHAGAWEPRFQDEILSFTGERPSR